MVGLLVNIDETHRPQHSVQLPFGLLQRKDRKRHSSHCLRACWDWTARCAAAQSRTALVAGCVSLRPKRPIRFSRQFGLLSPDVEVPAKHAASSLVGRTGSNSIPVATLALLSAVALFVHVVLPGPRRLAPHNPRARPAVLLSIPRRPLLPRDECPLSHKRPAAGDGCG